jgi:hypothetical protein
MTVGMKENLPLKCHWCGRFIADADLAWEEPYVSDLAVRLEPPELVPICPRCSDK